jgi:hypothetical protein
MALQSILSDTDPFCKYGLIMSASMLQVILELFARVMSLAVMRILPPWDAPIDSIALEMLVLLLFAEI